MNLATARAEYAACARAIAGSQDDHLRLRRPYANQAWRCLECHKLGRDIEARSLAIDLAVAALISGPGSYPATRLAAVDAAREAGVAW